MEQRSENNDMALENFIKRIDSKVRRMENNHTDSYLAQILAKYKKQNTINVIDSSKDFDENVSVLDVSVQDVEIDQMPTIFLSHIDSDSVSYHSKLVKVDNFFDDEDECESSSYVPSGVRSQRIFSLDSDEIDSESSCDEKFVAKYLDEDAAISDLETDYRQSMLLDSEETSSCESSSVGDIEDSTTELDQYSNSFSIYNNLSIPAKAQRILFPVSSTMSPHSVPEVTDDILSFDGIDDEAA